MWKELRELTSRAGRPGPCVFRARHTHFQELWRGLVQDAR